MNKKREIFTVLIAVAFLISFCLVNKPLLELVFSHNNDRIAQILLANKYYSYWSIYDDIQFEYENINGITTLIFKETKTDFFLRTNKGYHPSDGIIPLKPAHAYISMPLSPDGYVRGDLSDISILELHDGSNWILNFEEGIKMDEQNIAHRLTAEDYTLFEKVNTERVRFTELLKDVKREVIKAEFLVYGVLFAVIAFLIVLFIGEKNGKFSIPLFGN